VVIKLKFQNLCKHSAQLFLLTIKIDKSKMLFTTTCCG